MQMIGKMPFSGRTALALTAGLSMALLVAGCSKAPHDEAAASSDASVDAAAPASNEAVLADGPATAAPAADASRAEAIAAAAGAAANSAGEGTDRAGASAFTGADPGVAPGVAFTYAFSFRLADDKVSAAQDAHVTACARLGVDQCRVTGLSYNQTKDGPVTGQSSFLLDPAVARAFTRDATDAVARLDGDLMDSRVGGEDVGTGISASQRRSARMGGDLDRLEKRLAQPGLGARERAELQRQVAQLKSVLNGEEDRRMDEEARLASTPVQFTYSGTTGATGFNRDRPFASAFDASWGSLKTASAFVLTLLGITLPWLLLVGAVVAGIRLATRRRQAAAVSET